MVDDVERLRRWRLILGGDAADGTGVSLTSRDQALDRALAAVYDADNPSAGKRRAGLAAHQRRPSPGGSATSAGSFAPRSSAFCSMTPWTGSACVNFCWNRKSWKRSNRTCISSPTCWRSAG